MKKLIQSFCFLILLPSYLLPQWSTDPNNNLIIAYGWDPHIVSDSAGGCYVTYNYESFYPQKLAVERLDLYGYKPWGNKKQILGELPEQWQAEIIEDGEGGVIISYEDNEDNGTVFTTRVRVQRVDSNGIFLWGQTGIRASVVDTNQGSQRLVSDGNGGCVIVWMISSSDYSAEYWINRMDGDGQRLWSDTGIYIQKDINWSPASIVRASDGNYYVQIRRNLYRIRQNGDIARQDSTTLVVIVPDTEGGIVQSGITGNTNNRKLVAQRKDSLGNNLWLEPYVEIADSLDINAHLNIKHNNDFIYYSWTGKKNGIEKVVQFQALRLNGTILLAEGSLQVGTPPLGGAYIVPLEKNRTAFIYHETNYLPDSLIAQSYDSLGNKLWDTGGVLISHPSIEYQSFNTDGSGGFIIGGVIDNFTVVAQQINKYGYLGEIITDVTAEEINIAPTEINLYQNYPNPFNSTTVIKYQIPVEGNVNISLYNILGERLSILSNEYKSKGLYSIIFNSDNLPSGVYIYTLETNNQVLTKKLTILK
jgi:hypothetical protein